jgi:cell division protein FtsQ
MAHKQAKRRKSSNTTGMDLSKLRLNKILAPLCMIGVILITYQLSPIMLDREITSLEISGPFQRVTALHIEDAINEEISAGFIGADIDRIKDLVIALPWIDQARITRRWPSHISITVTEQIPAAVWHEHGLLNTHGELFIKNARHIPAELPRLSGPNNTSDAVARRYLGVREQLISRGLDVRRVNLNNRGSWEITLVNGINVRLGGKAVDERINLFLNVVTEIIVSRSEEIDYVDMRYANGFAIAWKNGLPSPTNASEKVKQKTPMMARGSQLDV